MKEKKYYIALDDFERRVVVNCMNEMRNKLIADGKYTDALDEVLCTFASPFPSAVPKSNGKYKVLFPILSRQPPPLCVTGLSHSFISFSIELFTAHIKSILFVSVIGILQCSEFIFLCQLRGYLCKGFGNGASAFLSTNSRTAAVVNIYNWICCGKFFTVNTCGVFTASGFSSSNLVGGYAVAVLLTAGGSHKEILVTNTALSWIMPVM